MDWFATIAELTGTNISNINIDGKSLMPVIKKSSAPSQHEVSYWQHGSYDDNIAQWVVRKGDWKLIGNPRERIKNQEPIKDKLFLANLKMDISETENLIEKYPEEANKLNALHDSWLKEVKNEMSR
jgi:arylsulfatase A-like enzyme